MNKLIFKINYGGKLKPLRIKNPSDVKKSLDVSKKKKSGKTVSIEVIDFKTGKKLGTYEREEFTLKFL